MPEPILHENIKEDDEIDLMDLFLVLWKRRWLIISIVGFSILIVGLFIFSQQEKKIKTEIVISLSFDGIDKGLYPDGSTFESNDIVSPSILNDLDINIDLSGRVFADGIIPDNIKAKKDEDPGLIYHPNWFKIILLEDDEILFDSNQERADVLTAIANKFKEQFKKRFIEKSPIAVYFPDNFIQVNEYDDITNIFNKNIEIIKILLMQKQNEAGLFRSIEMGYTFSEMLSELNLLQEIELKGVVSKIATFNIARNKEIFSAKIENDIKNIEYELFKNEKIADVSFELLKTVWAMTHNAEDDKIIRDTQFLIDTSVLDKLKASEYVFYLIKSNLTAQTNAIENSVQIKRLKARLEELEKNNKEFNSVDDEITKELSALQDKLINIVQKTNAINKEYLYLKFAKAINVNNTPTQTINYLYNFKLILSLTFVASVFFSILLSLLADYIIRYKKSI